MATLVSAGVEVTVVDESAYGAPGAGTVPLLLVATQQDKSDPTGSEADGKAKFTKSANAGKVVKVTSQRELTQFFGNPTFTKNGATVVQGSETSEYGLMAAYSYLGQGNQAFIVRADLNLGQLEASTTAPTAVYSTAGTLWLDTDASSYGIHQWNTVTSKWENKIPAVEINVDDGTDVVGDVHTPATAASATTNGTFLVVVHVDNEASVSAARQMSIEYFYGVGGAWEILDSDGNLSSGETVTYDEHFSAPSTPGAGDVWVKTTRPGNGLALSLSTHNGTSFTAATVQGISTTQADGAGAITDFVSQDGSSTSALTTSTATVGNYLLDQQANTKATIIIREITTGGAVGDLTATTVLAQSATPTGTLATGTYWFDNTINSLDLYVVTAGAFLPKSATYSSTAPVGPASGDIWVDTSLAAENQTNERAYPHIKVYNGAAWISHDNTDQTTTTGVLFADITDTAADATNGGNATVISGGPNPAVYPNGMVAVNMAQSKNTVRKWNGTAWRNGVSNHADGSGRFGRYAQRGVIATAMQAVAAGTDLRDPQYKYSLLAAPNYPELVDEMVTLNSDRGETAFIIIDSPMRKNPTDVVNWTKNSGNATENGEDGLVTKNTYSAVYYPSGNTTEPVEGNTVAVPPSHMALYTFAYNDNISFQWFAPAGTTRGVVQNASAVGHITTEGEFKAISLTQGQRDAMYTDKLNPIATFPGQGTIVFGQKTLHATASSLDRVNVARLVAYLRERFDDIARPFLFEINDAQTRARAKIVFERFLSDILSRRGLNDFAVVCDETNNTPARIDRNEFYVDVAIEPSKAAEFIYVPIRLVNTGTLSTTN
tara:strand:- start:7494 stop:9989 length:2496 start_codon:yes stop_codon:yes gene_type:complete